MTTWTVLAPGPSLADLDPETFAAPGPVVAMNSAAECRLPFDFWCCLDRPQNFKAVWEHLSELERRRLCVILCNEHRAPEWVKLGFRVWTHPRSDADMRGALLPNGFEWRSKFTNRTIYTAIARCVGAGARRVDLYGVDMAGEGYAYGEDLNKRNAKAWDVRWKDERGKLETLREALGACGISLVRHAAAPISPTDHAGQPSAPPSTQGA